MKSLSRLAILLRPSIRPSTFRPVLSPLHPLSQQLRQPRSRSRPFSSTYSARRGLQPDTEEPKAPSTEGHGGHHALEPAHVSDGEYHELADQYIDTLVLKLEEMAEEKKDIEVEYSAGVLTLNHPAGTYIVNKQPPNKQIWLSSPVSGPKRYDWVVSGDGQHQKQETETHEEGGGGKWIYLRDSSTLTELLEKEVGIDMGEGHEDHALSGKGGPAGSGVSE